MSITVCPHCKMRIIPKQDGTCPSCFAILTPEEIVKTPQPAEIPPKKGAKAASRRKSAGGKKAAAELPSAHRAPDAEQLYWEYRQTAEEVWKGSLRASIPYYLAGILTGVAFFLLSYLTWERIYVSSPRAPSQASWIFFWLGIIAIFIFALVGIFKGNQWSHAKIRELVHFRPGFQKYYGAFLRRNWPKDPLAAEPKVEPFLAMIGKK
jgi:hypothetical protein